MTWRGHGLCRVLSVIARGDRKAHHGEEVRELADRHTVGADGFSALETGPQMRAVLLARLAETKSYIISSESTIFVTSVMLDSCGLATLKDQETPRMGGIAYLILLATPIGFEPTISTVTRWHVNRYTTGPR